MFNLFLKDYRKLYFPKNICYLYECKQLPIIMPIIEQILGIKQIMHNIWNPTAIPMIILNVNYL